MKRNLNLILYAGVLFTLVISFISCGDREVVVTPSDLSISGPLGKYFQVVDRNYKIKDGYINIEIKRIENGLPNPWVEGIEVGYSDNRVEPGFIVEFLDEDGDILCKDLTDIVWEKDELVTVVALGVGETSSIQFGANVTKGLAAFKVSSTFKYHEPEEEPATVSSLSSKESSSAEWDKILDNYEKVVNNYVKVYNKAMDGDISALSNYMDLLKEVEDLAEELEDAEDEMSVSQMERYTKITAKLTEVALNAL